MLKRVVITGGSFNGNTGAEAMLCTVIGSIRRQYPDCEIGVFSPYYADDKLVFESDEKTILLNSSPLYLSGVVFPLSILKSRLKVKGERRKAGGKSKEQGAWGSEVKFLREAQIVFDIAGVAFVDGREKFIPFNVLSILPALILGIPVVKLSQALGPFENPINKFFGRRILEKCAKTYGRGSQTMKHLASLDLQNTQIEKAPDVALGHQPEFCISKGWSTKTKNTFDSFITHNQKQKIIGFCPSSVLFRGDKGETYFEQTISLLKQLVQRDYCIVLFPNATKSHKPNIYRNNDIPLLRKILERLEKTEKLLLLECDLNSANIRYIINQTNITVVSRFHAMIFSLLEKKPTVVISWSHKYKEVMESFELNKFVTDHSNSSPEVTFSIIKQCLSSEKEISQLVESKLPNIIETSRKQILNSIQNF